VEDFDADIGEAADAIAGFDDELLGLEPQEDTQRKARFQHQGNEAEEVDEVDADADVDPDAEPEEDADEDDDGPEKEQADQFVEIPNPNGGEPIRVAVADLIQSHQTLGRLGENVAAVIQRAEERVYEASRERVQAYDQALNQGIQTMRTWLTALPMPQQPDPVLLDPNSTRYNPDAFHLGRLQYEQAMGLIQGAKGQLGQMLQQQQAALMQRDALEIEHQRKLLISADPSWGQNWDAKRDALVSDLNKYFKISEEDLEPLTNHKFFLVAQAAVEMLKAREKAPALKKQVKEAAAKVTPKRNMPQTVIDQKRRNAADGRLRKTGSVDAAADVLLRQFGHVL
jgi:hypothetical protein